MSDSESEASATPAKVSQRFHADSDFDLIFGSRDGVVFHLHQKYLKINTKGFAEISPSPDDDASGLREIVLLTEAATTLELLFQFCYPEYHPDLEDIEFDELASLADAVEKYQVFSAMNICKIRMRGTLPLHAFDVLVYGANHDYPDVMELAAPLVVFEQDMSDIVSRMPAGLVIPWVVYHEKWRRIAHDARSYYRIWEQTSAALSTSMSAYGSKLMCSQCRIELDKLDKYVIRLLNTLGSDLRFLQDLDAIFPSKPKSELCDHFASSFSSWRTSIEDDIKNIPKFGKPVAEQRGSENIIGQNISSVNPVDSDITIQSSDGILFHVHKLNLALSSAGFAPSEFKTLDEIVQLNETSTTLDLLLKFCYPHRHPNVETLEFGVLAALAEAAEKYKVYSAMNICKCHMKKLLPKDAAGILVHAAKHGYPDILDIAGPLVLEIPLSDVLIQMPPHQIIPWVRYYEQWDHVWKAAISEAVKLNAIYSDLRCTFCNGSIKTSEFLLKLGGGVACLTDLNALLEIPGCGHQLKGNYVPWRTWVEANIANLRSFGSFL